MTAVIGSLCSGYGGLEPGLALALGGDVRTAWHVEYDKHPSTILAHRYPGVPNHGDVKTTDWAAVEPVDWMTAGYPCQPFSYAGKRGGADDPRHLWPDVARAIGVLRPRGVLLENVRGHVSLGLANVLGDLSGLGYDARWGVVRASDAGAPHGRARVFIVATDAGGERHGRGQGARGLGRMDGSDAVETRERQRARGVAGDRGAATVADAGGGPLAGATAAGDGLRVTAERGAGATPDTGGPGPQGRRPGRDGEPCRGVEARSTRSGHDGTAPDARMRGGRQEDPRGRDVVGEGGVQDGRQEGAGPHRLDSAAVAWGAYAPAVARWAAVTGRPAPRPTEPGRSGERLSPRFVEWLMGLPDGWVTDVPGIPRNGQLKALGNGVVPQQAALACRLLGVADLHQDAAA